MGWTFYHVNFPNKIEEVQKLYTWQEDDRGAEVADIAAKGSIVYVAVHYWNHAKNEDFIYAAIVRTASENKDYYNFGYKDMSESMNPYYYDCPKRILDLLTPTDNAWANEWREKCRLKRERTNALNRIKPGTRILSGGKTLELFTTIRRGKVRKYWLLVENGRRTNTYWRQSWIINHDWEAIQSEV